MSVADVADRTTGCIAAGDANCIYGSIQERERSALGLSSDKIDAVLKGYVLPSYVGLAGSPRKDSNVLKEAGMVQSTWTWTVPGRGPVKFGSSAVITPDGARSICTTQWMIFNAMDARYRKTSKEEGIVVYLRGLEKDAGRLTQLGIPGIFDARKGEVIKWPELIERYRAEIDKAGLSY